MSKVVKVTDTPTGTRVDLTYQNNGFFNYDMSCGHNLTGKDYRRWQRGQLVHPKTITCRTCGR